jgi:hypothetical protein
MSITPPAMHARGHRPQGQMEPTGYASCVDTAERSGVMSASDRGALVAVMRAGWLHERRHHYARSAQTTEFAMTQTIASG